MSFTTAEEILGNSSLSLELPVSALEIPGVAAAAGVPPHLVKKAIEESIRRKTPTARIELDSVAWEWETDTHDFYDEGGSKDSMEVRANLLFDQDAARRLETRGQLAADALRWLGIPFDCHLTDGLGGPGRLWCGRLNAQNPTDYCEDATPRGKPGFDEILHMAAQAEDLADLAAQLSEFADDPRRLPDEAERFRELSSAPGRREFIEASAQLLELASMNSRRFPWGAQEPQWDPRMPGWAAAQWNGEGPMNRFARLGMPIPLPSLARLIDLAMSRPDPDPSLLLATLDAYCRCLAEVGRRYGRNTVPPAEAAKIGHSLGAHPQLASLMSPEAMAVFDLDLRARSEQSPERDYALAEAHWLRAQSIAAKPAAPATARPRSL